MIGADVLTVAPDGERLLDSQELAKVLGCSPSAITNNRKRPSSRLPIPAPDMQSDALVRPRAYWRVSTVARYLEERLDLERRRLDQSRVNTARAVKRFERAERALNELARLAPIGAGPIPAEQEGPAR